MNANRHHAPPPPHEASLKERAAVLRAAPALQAAADQLTTVNDTARRYADQFDFSPYSIEELARLYEIAKRVDGYWSLIGNMPLCVTSDATAGVRSSSIGWFVEAEENRMSFLRDRCVAELARRSPSNKREQNEILCARLEHEMDCNGEVSLAEEPTLIIEALKAWG